MITEFDCSARAELRTDGVHFADDRQLRRTAMEGILATIVSIPDGATPL